MKPKQTSKFSRVKSKGQLVELEYKDFLSPSGRKLQTNENIRNNRFSVERIMPSLHNRFQ